MGPKSRCGRTVFPLKAPGDNPSFQPLAFSGLPCVPWLPAAALWSLSLLSHGHCPHVSLGLFSSHVSHIGFRVALLQCYLILTSSHLHRLFPLNNVMFTCWGPAWGTPPMAKVMRKEARRTQRRDRASGVPLEILEHLPPKPEPAYFTTLCSYLHLWLYGGLSPTTSFGEGVNLELQLIKTPGVTRVF